MKARVCDGDDLEKIPDRDGSRGESDFNIRFSSSISSLTSSLIAAIFSSHSRLRLSLALASASAAAANILLYKAVTEFPRRRRRRLVAVEPRDATALLVVLRQDTQRHLHCDRTVRDHRACIIEPFFEGSLNNLIHYPIGSVACFLVMVYINDVSIPKT